MYIAIHLYINYTVSIDLIGFFLLLDFVTVLLFLAESALFSNIETFHKFNRL